MDQMAARIKNTALQMGYEKCGIIKLSAMAGYREKLDERIRLFPEVKPAYEGFYKFGQLEKEYPWAKSIVICVVRYGKYKVPENMEGLIGKYYLFDFRLDQHTKEYQNSIQFEAYLKERGIRAEAEKKFGITAFRWAAMQAGLGLVRKNNFFYTESGSWVTFEGWLIDQELESVESPTLKKCPDRCENCMEACPTGSLSGPYTMNRSSCIASLNTWEAHDLINEKHRGEMGRWIYGCDLCQDSCPLNRNHWQEVEDFPGLEELSASLSLEKIVAMDYEDIEKVIKPKYWYIRRSDLWQWKTTSISAMVNSYEDRYRQPILSARGDSHPKVREMAEWAIERLGLE